MNNFHPPSREKTTPINWRIFIVFLLIAFVVEVVSLKMLQGEIFLLPIFFICLLGFVFSTKSDGIHANPNVMWWRKND